MNNRTCLLAALLLMVLASSPGARATDAPLTPAGHWEGAITLPTTALGIRVDLSRNGDLWRGTIDIPVQGLHGFRLDPVKVGGAVVEFAMPGISGAPHFAGNLADDGSTLAGEFTQGGGRFPFKLERKMPPASTGETPAAGIPGNGLGGHWQGTLRPSPVMELRLALEITSADPGKPEGVLISLDQGNARIPITALTERNGVAHFECSRINGVFDGKLNADGSEMIGEWRQNGTTLPLAFKRLARAITLEAPERPQEPKPPFPYATEDVDVRNPLRGSDAGRHPDRAVGPGTASSRCVDHRIRPAESR